jgi:spoIIIJ-associated protein
MKENLIKETVEEFFQRLDVGFDSVLLAEPDALGCLRFSIKSASSGALLIGARGEHLMAINHLLTKIVAKASGDKPAKRFFVDVNDYQEKLIEELKLKAKIMSERARSFKADIELPPMSAYERMLVHTYLDSASDLKTESVGEGKGRRVVIRYVEHRT